MHAKRARPATRFLAILAMIVTVVASGGRNVEAFDNPFSLGFLDTLNCSSGSPVLELSIKNTSAFYVSQYTNEWKSPILYVAYLQADGSQATAQASIPNIPAGNEQGIDVPVKRADTTFTIAIHASDPSGHTVKLLTGTAITPADHCPLPPKLVTTTLPQTPVSRQITNNINEAPFAAYVKDTPTGLSFPKGGICQIQGSGQSRSCIDNNGFGLTISWAYDGPADAGFRIYRVDHGAHAYMTSVSRKLNVFGAVLPPPKTGDFSGQCFAVVAVRNSVETNLSPAKCATAHDSLHETVLKTDVARSWGVETENGGGLTQGEYGETRVDTVAVPYVRKTPTSLVTSAGYAHDTNTHTFSADEVANLVVRFGAHFNMAPYAGDEIEKATFSLLAANSLVNYNSTTGSCPMQVAPARSNGWLTSPNDIYIDLDPGKAGAFRPVSGAGAVQTVNETSLVQDWANNPNANFGLIVRGTDENLGAKLNGSSCLSVLGGSLDIQYY